MKFKLQRTCMGCNKKQEKQEFVRIVKNKDGKIEIDIDHKKEGRGAYLCKNIDCLEKLKKSKRLEKVWKCKIENEIYENLRGVIFDK